MTNSSAPGAGRPDQAREHSNIEVLKALADPLRMNLLYALTRTTKSGELPVMSVKELAAALGESQTKLYRHVRTLEAAGLIRAAASRIVSGIVEQRYQASQADLTFGDELSEEERSGPDAEAMTAAAFEWYRRQYFAALRTPGPGNDEAAAPYRRALLGTAEGLLPAARAAQIREQLQQLFEELAGTSHAAEGLAGEGELVRVNLLIGYFARRPPPQ